MADEGGAELLAFPGQSARPVDLERITASLDLYDGSIEGFAVVKRGTRAEDAVASDQGAFDSFSAYQFRYNRDRTRGGKIDIGDLFAAGIEGLSGRERLKTQA